MFWRCSEASADHAPPDSRELSPSYLVEMIIIDAEVMRNFVNQRPGDFFAKLIRWLAQLHVRSPEDVDNVGQFAGVISPSIG